MQFAKDSFLLAMQARLSGLNPARTVTINGATSPAVVAIENLPPAGTEPQPNCFYLEWGTANVVDGHAGNAALMSLNCVISYYTLGTVPSMVDRGRVLGQLDNELLGICQPTNTEKFDYSQSPSVEDNQLAYQGRAVRKAMYEQAYQDGRAERRAQLTVFFFSEVMIL
jgi:hypothetical protein